MAEAERCEAEHHLLLHALAEIGGQFARRRTQHVANGFRQCVQGTYRYLEAGHHEGRPGTADEGEVAGKVTATTGSRPIPVQSVCAGDALCRRGFLAQGPDSRRIHQLPAAKDPPARQGQGGAADAAHHRPLPSSRQSLRVPHSERRYRGRIRTGAEPAQPPSAPALSSSGTQPKAHLICSTPLLGQYGLQRERRPACHFEGLRPH